MAICQKQKRLETVKSRGWCALKAQQRLSVQLNGASVAGALILSAALRMRSARSLSAQ